MSEPLTPEDRHSILLDVARRLSSTQNLDELLDHILERSREVMDCEVCSILLPEEGGGGLLIRSTLDPINAEPVVVPKGKGIAGEVYATKRLINIEDARSDPRHFTPSSDKSGLVTRAMITIPLLEGERCLGVMQAINPNHEEFFRGRDVEIFETFGSLIAVTLLRLETQKSAIREAENRQQLSLAREIQNSFLPPGQVRIGNIEVEAFYEPASEIGGDFFFWHELEDEKILLGIGDVCGKGLPAALDMARGATLIASMAHNCDKLGLAKWVTALNRRLCDVMRAGRFIAINAMLVDPKHHRVQVLDAGLPASKFFDGSSWQDVDTPGNPPLGISCAVEYKQSEHSLGAGRYWLIFSDGILELQNSKGDYFEDAGFGESLERISREGSRSVLRELVKDWQSHANDPAYQDDATILTVTNHEEPPPAEFAFSCRPEVLVQARNFIEQWAEYSGLDDEAAGLVILGCDEVFNNICQHAYCDTKGNAPASCRVTAKNGSLNIQIHHYGEGISNEDFEKLIAPPSSDRIGGLGMHVISEVFDKINFRKEPEKSTIELVKHTG